MIISMSRPARPCIGDRIGDEFRIAIQFRNLRASFHAVSIFDYLTRRSQAYLPCLCGTFAMHRVTTSDSHFSLVLQLRSDRRTSSAKPSASAPQV